MMGGGFGGCTINIIENDAIESISRSVIKAYESKFGIEPNIYITTINNGTNVLRQGK